MLVEEKMITKFELSFKIHTNKEPPFEMKIGRSNPSKEQITAIRKWINNSIDEYLEEYRKM